MKIEYIGISDERKEEAQIRLCIKSGSANDVAGKEGTAHLLEHINLLFDKLVHFALFGGRKCVLERSLCGA